MFCQILHCKVIPASSHNVFDGRPHYEQLTQKEGKVMLHLLKGKETHTLLGIFLPGEICLFCSFMYLLNHLFISLWTHYMYVLFWVIIDTTLLCCSNPSSSGLWELSPWAPDYPSLIFSSTSLFSEAIRCSRLILSISCPSPKTNHFSKEPWIFC